MCFCLAMGQHCTTFYSHRHASNRSAAVGEVRAMAGGACGGEARPVSGGRGSSAGARCALRRGGSAIGRLPSPAGRCGVHASARRPHPSFPETGRTSTGIRRVLASRALVPVTGARPLFAVRRLACVCGADAARCCRLAPPRPRIRRARRPSAASVRLAGPRARSAQPLLA